ncbi:hypothetical protein FOG18_13265 [Legionella israelensis]|uniref:FliM/FliN family flagellar motor switch protein n=1 Tax=Legionella israelensis TaxID=454 RepID=UPI00117D0BE6|nr:FliM/FliN family flagellar motor switch protein [Legionella israelensis]QDP73464.1 hypothetical protein FOG18_13265 [Legionella israelensis]
MQDESNQNTSSGKMAGGMNLRDHFLNDITLEVHVEIGRAKIKISDVMELSKGSVVELEQNPQEPLIIYANNKEIAKGQIISSNGKYNIRIL